MVGIKLVNTFERHLDAQHMQSAFWLVQVKEIGMAFFNFLNGCGNLLLLVKNQHKLAAFNKCQPLKLILGYLFPKWKIPISMNIQTALQVIKTSFVLQTEHLMTLEPTSFKQHRQQKLLDLQSQSFELTIRDRVVSIYWSSYGEGLGIHYVFPPSFPRITRLLNCLINPNSVIAVSGAWTKLFPAMQQSDHREMRWDHQ